MVGNNINFPEALKRIMARQNEKTVDIDTPMGLYSTSETKAAELSKFFEENDKEYTGAIGGQYTYSFTPTSLGTILVIHDEVTKKSINVTDYENW